MQSQSHPHETEILAVKSQLWIWSRAQRDVEIKECSRVVDSQLKLCLARPGDAQRTRALAKSTRLLESAKAGSSCLIAVPLKPAKVCPKPKTSRLLNPHNDPRLRLIQAAAPAYWRHEKHREKYHAFCSELACELPAGAKSIDWQLIQTIERRVNAELGEDHDTDSLDDVLPGTDLKRIDCLAAPATEEDDHHEQDN